MIITAHDHIKRHTHTHIFGWIPLHERSVRSRDLYLHNTQH